MEDAAIMKRKTLAAICGLCAMCAIMLCGCGSRDRTQQPDIMPNGLVAGGAVTVAPEANTGLLASPVQRAFGIENSVEIRSIKLVMYANEDVDVRKGPGTGYDVAISLDKGDKVVVTGVCTNSWYRIKVDKKEYYVQRRFLSASKPTGEDDASVTTEEDEIYLPDEPTVTTEEDEIYLPDESSIVTAPVITVTYPTNPTYTLPIVTTTTPAETTVTTTTPAETTVTTTTPAETTVTTTTPVATTVTTTTLVVTTVTTTEPVPSVDDSFEIAESLADIVQSDIVTIENNSELYHSLRELTYVGITDANIKEYTYYSPVAEKNKTYKVQLPPNFSADREYPVLIILHGINGNMDTMRNDWWNHIIIDNMMRRGLAEEMIVVYPNMITSKDHDTFTEINLESAQAHDAFVQDIQALMSDLYSRTEFKAARGKENTAIFGFSMGGREALAIGYTYPEQFGYIGAACPAPGLTPSSEAWNPGQFQEDELKFEETRPYLIMIGASKWDGMVGQAPLNYHNIMSRNETYARHVWFEMDTGNHGDPTIISTLYNFARYIFTAK